MSADDILQIGHTQDGCVVIGVNGERIDISSDEAENVINALREAIDAARAAAASKGTVQ